MTSDEALKATCAKFGVEPVNLVIGHYKSYEVFHLDEQEFLDEYLYQKLLRIERMPS